MKKYLIVLSVFVFLPSCAQVKTQRKVHENTLYSSRPRLVAKIDSKYKYLGELDYSATTTSSSGASVKGYFNQYVFVLPRGNNTNTIRNNTANRIVFIDFHNVEGRYRANLVDDIPNKLEHGICDLGGKNYQCATFVSWPPAGHRVFQYLNKQKLLVPACTLTKMAARVYDSRGKRLVAFWYLEDVSDSDYLCSEWEDIGSLKIDK